LFPLSKHTKFSKMGNYRSKYNINMFIKLRRLIQAGNIAHTREIKIHAKF